MANQDILRTMMTQLDETSRQLPEGFYLQFCDHLRNLYRGEHDETFDDRSSTEEDARAELCRRQVMLFVYPIWYSGLAIYYLNCFIHGILVICYKGILTMIKARRKMLTSDQSSQTPLNEYGIIFVPEREWLGLIGVDGE